MLLEGASCPPTKPPVAREVSEDPAAHVVADDGAESLFRPNETGERRRSPVRVLALTDGIFAIIITIPVLEIAVPSQLSEESLRKVRTELRPTLLAWVVSFLITGMYWGGHRDLFARPLHAPGFPGEPPLRADGSGRPGGP